MKPNERWHDAHRLGTNAPPEARIAWHREHAANCGCRPIPASVVAQMRKRGIPVPSDDALSDPQLG